MLLEMVYLELLLSTIMITLYFNSIVLNYYIDIPLFQSHLFNNLTQWVLQCPDDIFVSEEEDEDSSDSDSDDDNAPTSSV